jgi:hypothetical protein
VRASPLSREDRADLWRWLLTLLSGSAVVVPAGRWVSWWLVAGAAAVVATYTIWCAWQLWPGSDRWR